MARASLYSRARASPFCRREGGPSSVRALVFSMVLVWLYWANRLDVDGYRLWSTPRNITSPMAAGPQGIRHCCGVLQPRLPLLWRRVNVAMSPSVSARLRAGTLLLPPSEGQTLVVCT